MLENSETVVVAIAFLIFLLGSGLGVAFLVGRRGGRTTVAEQHEDERRLPDRFARDLERCLELGDYVTRDADTLSAILAAESASVPRQVASAVKQLIKTTKSLAVRLNRIGVEACIARPSLDTRSISLPVGRSEPEPSPLPLPTATLAQDEIDAAPQTDKTVKLPGSPFEDARRFPRSSFRGSAKATIYPRHPGPGREPVQCMVLTRDLSCGGIGLAHCEQLFPKQIVVLDAVGKLLVGEIRWCRRVDENFYVAGCRLVKTNS